MRTVGLRVPVSLFAALLLAGVLPGCGGSSSSSPATTAVTAATVDSDMARLGIVGEDVDENFRVVAKSLGRKVPERGVAVIRFVDDPPAKAAGLVDSSAHQNAVQDSDIIETMDGEPVTAEQIEHRYAELVEEVKAEIHVPLAVKLGPWFTSFANLAVRLEAAGADGLVLFNRFYQPDINLDSMRLRPAARRRMLTK